MTNGWPELASWIGAAGAFATAMIAIVLAVQLRKREKRQALVELHASLTSGETAAARNTIGTLLHSKKKNAKPDVLTSIDAYFKLIWAIQRARNVFRVHGFHWTSLGETWKWNRVKRARSKEIQAALTWNLKEIADNVVQFHAEYGEKWDVEDADAWLELSAYLKVGD